ncbi:hypothetical protein WR25_10979 [Diploscapter pachys]|uniref:Uncharacterized protein n=1 Tax=Diploscapter pachys TaxID=2018661 RepID=A0A2A2KJY2_9BILA|nr:hypothetical protein WR25_10979 [Diploscapter pachys]
MARGLLERGPQVVLVKHLNYPQRADDAFEMLLVTREASWHLRRPLLAFPRSDSAALAPGGSVGAADPAGSGASLRCSAAGVVVPSPGAGHRRQPPW